MLLIGYFKIYRLLNMLYKMMRSVCDRKRDTAVYDCTQPLVTLSSNIQQFIDGVCRSVGIGAHWSSFNPLTPTVAIWVQL